MLLEVIVQWASPSPPSREDGTFTMSEQQQAVRQWVRSAWRELLHAVVEKAIQDAQEDDAAPRLADQLWPALPARDMVCLDRADRSLLRRGPDAIPAGFSTRLWERLVQLVGERLAAALPGNKYAQGGRLADVVRQEVATGKDIRRTVDWAFRERDTDDFTRPSVLREMVLRRLSTLAAEELAGLAATAPDAEPKRRLKILTALVTPGGTPESRAEILQALTSGRTAACPFVLKFVGAEAVTTIRSVEGLPQPTLDGFSPSLLGQFPAADLVRECLDRYVRREGVLTRLIDPEGPISDHLSQAWQDLDPFVPRQAGGIFMPKALALAERRRDRFRMPDGIACSLSIATLIESLLRQVVFTNKWGGPKNARGGELVDRVSRNITLAPATVESLKVIFDQRSLPLRDAMAHAAFFADDETRVEALVGGLSQTLAALMRDLAVAKVLEPALIGTRWDLGESLAAKHLALIDEQYGPGFNIVDQMKDDVARAHVFKVLAAATPDKRLLGSAGFLLWIAGQRDEHAGSAFDDAQQFAALFGSLVTLEELLRALYEANNQRVLRVTPSGGTVRCHLAMLDDQPGELLEADCLKQLFQHCGIEEACIRSFLAVKAVRDLAFHGCWGALPRPWARYTHLAVKLIFMLCSIAHFSPPRKAGDALTAEEHEKARRRAYSFALERGGGKLPPYSADAILFGTRFEGNL